MYGAKETLEKRNCILLEFIWRKNKIVKVYREI